MFQILRHRAEYQRHSSPNLGSLCCGCGVSSLLRMAKVWQKVPWPCCLEGLGWNQGTVAFPCLGCSGLSERSSMGFKHPDLNLLGAVTTLWSCHFLRAVLTWLEHHWDEGF